MAENHSGSSSRLLAISTFASALLIAGSIVLPGHSAEKSIPLPVAASTGTTGGFADLIEHVRPSVVTIEVEKTLDAQRSAFSGDPRAEEFLQRFFGRRGMPRQQRQQRTRGAGSGFIIDDSGYIVTNNHVVDGADSVSVRLSDERQFDAEVVGYDDKTDLALLKIDADNLTVSTLGDSDATRVGDWVIAIGNPFGLGGTATVGIVSARGRDIRSGPYDDYMQIDAPINHGNSGGPVFNTAGEVVGVNTAIYSPNGGSVGIGFAIPANQVSDIVDELRDSGTIDRGWLGVQLQNIDEDLAEGLGLDAKQGTLVSDVVPGSPADRAGIEVGDVITGYRGEQVADARALSRMVGSSDSGEKVHLNVLRGAKELNLKVTLGDAEAQVADNGNEHRLQNLGLVLAPLSDDLRQRLNVDSDVTGTVVMNVDPDGLAAQQGIRRGDILLRADRQPISSPSELEKTLEKAKEKGRRSVPVLVRRGDIQQFASLPVA